MQQITFLLALNPSDVDAFRAALDYAAEGDTIVLAEIGTVASLDIHIEQHHPDVVVYDPTLDNGRTLVRWPTDVGKYPLLVCATTDATFAIEAFDAGAVHFLQPPFTARGLQRTLQRIRRVLPYVSSTGKPRHLRESSFGTIGVVALPVNNGMTLRRVDDIVYVRGEGSYSRVEFTHDPAIILSRTVGDCEASLHGDSFLRVHRSSLVNLQHIVSIQRGKQHRLKMMNGHFVDVSDTYRDALFERLQVIGRKRECES